MMAKIEIIGQRFGHFVIIEMIGKGRRYFNDRELYHQGQSRCHYYKPLNNKERAVIGRQWRCRCDCGEIVKRSGIDLVKKRNDCGCLLYATNFARGTKIGSKNIPFEILNCLKKIHEIKKELKKQAS